MSHGWYTGYSMREREQYALAVTASETKYQLWELENRTGELNLDKIYAG